MKFLLKYYRRIRWELKIKELKKRGLKLGDNVVLNPSCFIDPSHCWHISIGDNTLVAAEACIYAHDGSLGRYLEYGKIGNTTIGKRVFVGARSIILPGVTIGDDVIIGVGSVVNQDIPSNSVALGNPAKVICSLDLYLMIEQSAMHDKNCFDKSYTMQHPKFTESKREELIEACKKYRKAFVK